MKNDQIRIQCTNSEKLSINYCKRTITESFVVKLSLKCAHLDFSARLVSNQPFTNHYITKTQTSRQQVTPTANPRHTAGAPPSEWKKSYLSLVLPPGECQKKQNVKCSSMNELTCFWHCRCHEFHSGWEMHRHLTKTNDKW